MYLAVSKLDVLFTHWQTSQKVSNGIDYKVNTQIFKKKVRGWGTVA